jgi:antitoxin MazE
MISTAVRSDKAETHCIFIADRPRSRISAVGSEGLAPMRTQITRWGNSLGLRVPKPIATQVGLKAGAEVEITAEDGRIIVSAARPAYSLNELLTGMTPAAMHTAFDWGADVGREAVE